MNDFFSAHHFSPPASTQETRELFKKSITNVVIEISSFCNRQCTYCPVSQADRSSTNNLLADGTFSRITDDLASISYKESICLNLYNEPMADRELLLSRVRQLRQAMPECRIYFSTNGDYLNPDYLKALVEAGLSELYVTLHHPKGQPYNDAHVVSRFCELSAKMNKPIKVKTVSPGHTVQGTLALFGITLNVFSTNYTIYGSDRAGAITDLTAKTPARTAPCSRPFNDFTISYDGTIFPCCQMFADNSDHKQNYSIGNITEFPSIFDAYASPAMAGWRRSLLRFGPKAKPCDTCSEGNCPGTKQEHQEKDRIYEKFIGPIITTSNSIKAVGQTSSAKDKLKKLFRNL